MISMKSLLLKLGEGEGSSFLLFSFSWLHSSTENDFSISIKIGIRFAYILSSSDFICEIILNMSPSLLFVGFIFLLLVNASWKENPFERHIVFYPLFWDQVTKYYYFSYLKSEISNGKQNNEKKEEKLVGWVLQFCQKV